MKIKEPKNIEILSLIFTVLLVVFSIEPIFGTIGLIIAIILIKKNYRYFNPQARDLLKLSKEQDNILTDLEPLTPKKSTINQLLTIPLEASNILFNKTAHRLEKRKKYLQVALNSTLDEAREIILQLPASDRILIEAGTPLIKIYGTEAVSFIKNMSPAGAYIVADSKCADLAKREVEMMSRAGANAVTCLGVAPIETIDNFIEACQEFNVDSMIDMMNVNNALLVLKKLKKLPDVVILHRGVDETEFSKEKQIPYYQIKQIKGSYNILVSIAGGDTIKEIQRATFNSADIVVVWKNFYQANLETAQLAEAFLKEIK